MLLSHFKTAATLALFSTVLAQGQTVSTLPADQTSSGEFQAQLDSPDAGSATFYVQAAFSRDAAGVYRAAGYGVFGWTFSPRDVVITGVEIRRGEVVLRPGMAPRTVIRGGQGGFSGGGTAAGSVGVLSALLTDPDSVEVRILTEDRPDGLYRGKLGRATVHYLAGFTEAAAGAAPALSGYEVFLASVTRDAAGRIDSAMTQAQLSYVRGAGSGLAPTRGVYPWTIAIHEGARGAAGPAVAAFGNPSDGFASVPGHPGSEMRGLDMRDAAQRDPLERLLERPGNFYVQLANAANPNGLLRAQLRRMDRAIFDVRLGGPADSTVYLEADFTREEDGTVNSGILYNISDWGTAAGPPQVRSLRLHAGAASETGPALATLATGETGALVGRFLISAVPVLPEDGVNRAALDRLINYPDLVYLDAITAASPGGLRAQAIDFPGQPAIDSIRPATGADGPLAPGMLVTIRGRRLAKVTSGLDAFAAASLPDALNGAVVQAGSRRARILFVSPTQINAQLPAEVADGASVAVNHGTAASNGVTVRVASAAPSLFEAVQRGEGGAVTVYGTGFGAQPRQVTAEASGAPVEVLSFGPVESLAGGSGLYQVTLRAPAQPGAIRVAVDGVASNAVGWRK